MTDKIVNFPASRIVRHNPTDRPNFTNKEAVALANAKAVLDNLEYELVKNYGIEKDKSFKVDWPLIEDIIKGMFLRHMNRPTEPEPDPPRYA